MPKRTVAITSAYEDYPLRQVNLLNFQAIVKASNALAARSKNRRDICGTLLGFMPESCLHSCTVAQPESTAPAGS